MKKTLLSHSSSTESADSASFTALRQQIEQRGEVEDASVSELLKLFDQLTEFELGRFLLINKGLNAFWTNELVTWTAENPRALTPLEETIFTRLPATLATRERYIIFRQQLQNLVSDGAVFASVPCGVMSDLLNLSGLEKMRLVGIDLDEGALEAARTLAEQRGVAAQTELVHCDAWQLTFSNAFDVLTSNGLNIYQRSDEKVTELYALFHQALKKGGTLVTSFLTPPPLLAPDSSWRMALLDPALLRLQKLLFMSVIGTAWNAMRTEQQTRQQLTQAGFHNIRVIYDRAGLFPTVLAEKG